MRYRRARVDGGTYIFTVNLAERRRSLLVDYVDVLRKVVGMVKERHPFTIDTICAKIIRKYDGLDMS
jgi:putative transposase